MYMNPYYRNNMNVYLNADKDMTHTFPRFPHPFTIPIAAARFLHLGHQSISLLRTKGRRQTRVVWGLHLTPRLRSLQTLPIS